MENSTFRPAADSSNLHRFALLRLLATVSLTLLLVAAGGGPVWAFGPALWIASPSQSGVAGAVGGIIELRPGQLRKSGAPRQVDMTEGSGQPLNNASGVAFHHGSMWVVTLNNTVLRFGKGQLEHLSTNPTPTPRTTITSPAFQFILGVVFDKKGNMWVTDTEADGVHEISKAQLAAGSGSITPAVTITNTTALASPSFGVFDAAGNLWISSLGNNALVQFAANQLGSTGSPAPNIVISSPSLNAPGEMQFDFHGNLWVTNSGNNTVVDFTPAQLAQSGSPAATVVVSDDGSGSLDLPWGLQFDEQNRLWVFDYSSGDVVKYSPRQLKTSGSPVPVETLTGLPLYAAQLFFGPRY